MPSDIYEIATENDGVVAIDRSASIATAKKLGETNVTLIDKNLELALHDVPHRLDYEDSTRTVVVVTPVAAIEIVCNSMMMTNSENEIRLKLFSSNGRQMYIAKVGV